MHRPQIRISSNDHIRSPIQRNFQKPVVRRVAAFADQLNDGHELGCTPELGQEQHTFFDADIMIEFVSGKDLSQLGHGRLGKKQDALAPRFGDSLTRNGTDQHDSADEDVGINDKATDLLHESLASVLQDVGKNLLGHSPRRGLSTDSVHDAFELVVVDLANAVEFFG
jgi:hypothetical protein